MMPISFALATREHIALTSLGGLGRDCARTPPGQMVLVRSRIYRATCWADISQSVVWTTLRLILPPASCLSSVGS